jgi:hypothetical protein
MDLAKKISDPAGPGSETLLKSSGSATSVADPGIYPGSEFFHLGSRIQGQKDPNPHQKI